MNMNAQHTYLHDKNFQLTYFIEKKTNYDLRNKYKIINMILLDNLKMQRNNYFLKN